VAGRRSRPSLRHHAARSDAPPAALGETSLLDYVADLEKRIRDLPEKPVVIGHSMGGLLALLLCARGLARAAVLLTPCSTIERPRDQNVKPHGLRPDPGALGVVANTA
jgi:pimeloyl-ACP methyl ester carboxylesterase